MQYKFYQKSMQRNGFHQMGTNFENVQAHGLHMDMWIYGYTKCPWQGKVALCTLHVGVGEANGHSDTVQADIKKRLALRMCTLGCLESAENIETPHNTCFLNPGTVFC
jgi:hypothetical protein